MSVESWLAFVAATTLLVITPGPTVTLVVAYALAEGRRAAFVMVAGVALGDAFGILLALGGLGAALKASPALFLALRLAGGLYLLCLGVRLWRRAPVPFDAQAPRQPPWTMLLHTFLVTALNPAGLAFLFAFLPHVMEPAAPLLPQMLILSATFATLGGLNAGVYALLASGARGLLQRPRVLARVNRAGALVLIGFALVTLLWRR
jgi:threonine/homoserine/homoserine lactone efflux protein